MKLLDESFHRVFISSLGKEYLNGSRISHTKRFGKANRLVLKPTLKNCSFVFITKEE